MATESQAEKGSPASVWTVLATSFTMLGVMLVIVGGVGVMALGPINEKLAELQHGEEKTNLAMTPLLAFAAQHNNDTRQFDDAVKGLDSKLSIAEHKVYDRMTTDKIEALKSDLLRTNDEISHQVHALEGEIVTRSENEAHWAEIQSHIADLSKSVDALALRINALPSPSSSK